MCQEQRDLDVYRILIILITIATCQGVWSCKQIELSGTTFYSNFHGMYDVIQEETCNQRTVYKSVIRDVYLFYRPTEGWIFRIAASTQLACNSAGDTIVGADHTLYPHLVTTAWREIWAVWTYNLQITVQCRDILKLVLCNRMTFPAYSQCPVGTVIDIHDVVYVVHELDQCRSGTTESSDNMCNLQANGSDTIVHQLRHHCAGYQQCHPFTIQYNVYTIGCQRVQEFFCTDDIKLADFTMEYRCVRHTIGCKNISVRYNDMDTALEQYVGDYSVLKSQKCAQRNVYININDTYVYFYFNDKSLSWHISRMSTLDCSSDIVPGIYGTSEALFPEGVLYGWYTSVNQSNLQVNVTVVCIDKFLVPYTIPYREVNCTPWSRVHTTSTDADHDFVSSIASNTSLYNSQAMETTVALYPAAGGSTVMMVFTDNTNLAVSVVVPVTCVLVLTSAVLLTILGIIRRRRKRQNDKESPLTEEDSPGNIISYPEFVFDKEITFHEEGSLSGASSKLLVFSPTNRPVTTIKWSKSVFVMRRGRVQEVSVVREDTQDYGYLPHNQTYMVRHKWCNNSRYYLNNISRM